MKTRLIAVEIAEDEVIYLEADDDVEAPRLESHDTAAPIRSARGGALDTAVKGFDMIEGSIRTFIRRTMGAFQEMAGANVDRVTLEFGINVSGEAGIPYITRGKGEGNLRIKVECSFAGNKQG
ncbi:MAG: CU044_2847 family protein [Chromatiaceae bacterium]|jgi:hypothetical protein